MKKQTTNQQIAQEIYNWCKKNDLWGDNCIYFDGKAWAAWNNWGNVKGKQIANDLYEYENKNPRDYFPGGDNSIISMSFEGSLNHVLNAYVNGWVKLSNSFHKLFNKYGLVFEMYNSWNGNAYRI